MIDEFPPIVWLEEHIWSVIWNSNGKTLLLLVQIKKHEAKFTLPTNKCYNYPQLLTRTIVFYVLFIWGHRIFNRTYFKTEKTFLIVFVLISAFSVSPIGSIGSKYLSFVKTSKWQQLMYSVYKMPFKNLSFHSNLY